MLSRSIVRARQQGVSLIELMVGLSVGAIVVVGLLVAWSVFVQQNNYLLLTARLNQEVRAIFQVVTQDLRRAVAPSGTRAIELKCLSATNGCNPADVNPIIGDCVVFRANIDTDASTNFVSFVPSGMRVRNGVLEMWWPGKKGNDPLNPPDSVGDPDQAASGDSANYWYVSSEGQCAVDNASRWIPLLSENLENVQLQFAISDSRCLNLYVNSEDPGPCLGAPAEKVELLLVDVAISGAAKVGGANAASRPFSFSDTIKVRNDAIFQ